MFDCHSVLNHAGASWLWSFDPQPEYLSSSTDRRVHVVFGQDGPVDVTLTVTQSDGSSDTKTVLAWSPWTPKINVFQTKRWEWR